MNEPKTQTPWLTFFILLLSAASAAAAGATIMYFNIKSMALQFGLCAFFLIMSIQTFFDSMETQ
ncbi:MAG: hypothetical protein LBI01_03450 [Elusimicrobium sp.]|nr:hypothetical protein [Elusimicrobium sp.]